MIEDTYGWKKALVLYVLHTYLAKILTKKNGNVNFLLVTAKREVEVHYGDFW